MASETRGGRAKVAGTKRRKMYKDIEDTVSEAMTPKDTRSRFQRAIDSIGNRARKAQDAMSEYRLTGEVPKYKNGGDVRYNSKRGKCY